MYIDYMDKACEQVQGGGELSMARGEGEGGQEAWSHLLVCLWACSLFPG